MVEYLNVKQGTEEWLKLRYNYVTASCAAKVMGLDPYHTNLEYWESLKSQTPLSFGGGTKVAERGHACEQAWREVLELCGFDFVPQVVTNTAYPELMASLDGVDEDKRAIAEIKMVDKDTMIGLKTLGASAIPKHHMIQIQFQLMMCKEVADYALYCAGSWTGDDTPDPFEIEHDELQQKIIYEECKAFMESVKCGKRPEKEIGKGEYKVNDPGFEQLANIKEQIEFFKLKQAQIEEELHGKYHAYTKVRGQNDILLSYVPQGDPLPDWKKIVSRYDVEWDKQDKENFKKGRDAHWRTTYPKKR